MKRSPGETDITRLAAALAAHGVQYVMLGGAAMALHGFPRMTKDIDLLLPVDPLNNERLILALRQLPGAAEAAALLQRSWMDQGHSTELQAEVPVDLLYVAADHKYEDLQNHVIEAEVGGVKIRTLDVDGMLLSKATSRESDIPDRLKLERLRNALREQEAQRRAEALLCDDPGHAAFGPRAAVSAIYRRHAAAALAGTESVSAVNWMAVEDAAMTEAVGDTALDASALAEILCAISPGAVSPARQQSIRDRVAKAASRSSSPPQGSAAPRRED